MNFREACIEDIPALSELRLSVRENVLPDPGRITHEMYRSYLCEDGKGWVCEIEGEIAGFSVASLKDAYIWALFVKEEHEGKGIGTNLLRLATTWLFAKGAREVSLTTAAHTRADNFYKRLGWQRSEIPNSIEVRFTLEK